MAKKGFCMRLGKALRNRPILALRYRVTTALYEGSDAESPSRVGSHKGAAKIDFAAVLAAFITLRIAWVAFKKYWKKKRKKK